jgi:DNA-binding NarL/FixJ family response regulator
VTAAVRVLVVDDEPLFRHAVLAVVAETDGFLVVGEVGTGEAAVESAQQLRPDLVVMDVNLPGLDGVEATRRILADPAPDADRPVVLLLSTYDEDLGRDLVAECGAAGYLTKSALGPAALSKAWSEAAVG